MDYSYLVNIEANPRWVEMQSNKFVSKKTLDKSSDSRVSEIEAEGLLNQSRNNSIEQEFKALRSQSAD